jgi:signal transduction histidine kinase
MLPLPPDRQSLPADAPLSVLLVHDDQPASLRVRRLLRGQFGTRAKVTEAHDGEEALALLRQCPVDVALIDARLPDMPGLEVIARLTDEGGPTAAILMAGRGNERAAAEAMKHGAQDYVIKEDLDGPLLERTVQQALSAARLRHENERMAQQLRRTQSQMDHFLRAISHDMGANFMLLDNSFRQMKRTIGGQAPLPAAVEAAAHVEACLRESKRFLDDLSQLSSTGRVSMEAQRVELDRVAAEVLFEQQAPLAERGIAARVAGPLPAAWCNPARAKQVLTNLVRNAIKHGCDPCDPRIEIAAVPAPVGQAATGAAMVDPAASRVWLRVWDNGPGIPAAYREDIFLPGRRLPGVTAEGSGMGLAIVKRIIDHYGGTIFVDPAEQPGAAFVFSLPAATPID